MPEVGRWVSRDPIKDIGSKILIDADLWKTPNRQPAVRNESLYSYVANAPSTLLDPIGLNVWVPVGGVTCGKGCKPEITGCNSDNAALDTCCKKHEQNHLDNAPAGWCTKKTVIIITGSGTGVVKDCCPDEGNSYVVKDVLASECPAYAVEADCLKSALDSATSLVDKIRIKDRLKTICGILKGTSRPSGWPTTPCSPIPSVCDAY